MPKITALRTLVGRYGRVEAGEAFDCPPATAKSLLDRGLAVKVAVPPRQGLAAASNPGAASGPLAGSPTGAAKPASSSGRGRAPAASTSSEREDPPAS